MITLVDDDVLVCRAVSRLLRSAGFDVKAFGSAAELLDSNSGLQASCFVIDIHLGVVSGFDLVESLRAGGTQSPIVFITAFDDEVTRKRADLVGSSGYLRKPFTAAALLEAVQTAVGGQQPAADR